MTLDPKSIKQLKKAAVIYAHIKKQNSIKSVHCSLSQLNTSQLQKTLKTKIDAALLVIVCSEM